MRWSRQFICMFAFLFVCLWWILSLQIYSSITTYGAKFNSDFTPYWNQRQDIHVNGMNEIIPVEQGRKGLLYCLLMRSVPQVINLEDPYENKCRKSADSFDKYRKYSVYTCFLLCTTIHVIKSCGCRAAFQPGTLFELRSKDVFSSNPAKYYTRQQNYLISFGLVFLWGKLSLLSNCQES